MRRDATKWLEDIVTACNDCLEFLEGKSPDDYVADKALRASVERKLMIVGEAVAQLRIVHPEVAEQLGEARHIVAFRNILVHGYFALDHRRVFDIAQKYLPSLLQEVEELTNVE
jgi:uncharacterized protein with HEPN domain